MASRSPQRTARALSTLSGRTPEAVRRGVVDALFEAAEADIALFYSLHVDEEGQRAVSIAVATDPLGVDAVLAIAQDTPRYLRLLDTRAPPALQRRAFVPECETFDLSLWHRSPVFQEIYRPRSVGSQQRLLIYDGDRFVGWLGFLREEGNRSFTKEDRRRVAPLVRPCIEALIAADHMERAAVPEEMGDLLVAATGEVLLTSENGRAWLAMAGVRERVADAVRRVDRGERGLLNMAGAVAGITRLEGEGTGVAYVVRLSQAAPAQLSPLALLSPRQREVVNLAASGRTLDEIAAALDVGTETVREHLKVSYRRLGVSTRAELAGVAGRAKARHRR